ncbi:uncharacterized protein LOC110826941 isoform X1 [Zootermopsis nevadensis]|uniref:uncharacterized protein LOC110826941 isoform X1 n=1 Tax=Zootermopsis nevadensis TaxID=136037 RepID=UPI000B8E430D|nr:uncharacterized protein LOC110826941 isoform X1 [Zootermopsis nevadensis]
MKSQGRGRRINCCSGVQAAHRQQLRPLVIEERPSSAVSNESYSGVASCSCGYGLCCSISSASTQTKPLPSCLQLPICTHLQRIHITLLHKLCCTLLIWLPKFRDIC